MRTIVSGLFVAALALAFAACKPNAAAAPAPAGDAAVSSQADALFSRAGFQIPSTPIMSTDFTLVSLEGKKLSLSSFRGKVVVLSFWATWCVPCQEEMPGMQALYESLHGRGFEIVAVDVMEDKAKVGQYRKEHGYTFPILLDSGGDVSGSYGVQGIPANFVIDAQGRVRARVVGVGGPTWTSGEMKALFEHLLSS